MLIKLKKKTILIDLGKGTFFGDAVMYANDKNHKIYERYFSSPRRTNK